MICSEEEEEDDPRQLPDSPMKRCTRGGILNKGNSCYLSATLQLLLHVPHFSSMLSENAFSPHSVRGILSSLNSQNLRESAMDPEPLLRELHRFAPSLKRFRQEDAHECLVLLLEKIIAEFQSKVTPIHRIFACGITEIVSCEQCLVTSSVRNLMPLVTTLSVCGLNDLEEIVAHTLKMEQCEGTCENCGHGMKNKMTVVMKAPQMLTLMLPRFMYNEQTGQFHKNCSPIYINKTLNFSGHKYLLTGLIQHFGPSKAEGHYTAVCQDKEHWYQFDDSKVSPVNIFHHLESSQCQESCYIVMFQKLNLSDTQDIVGSLSQLMSNTQDDLSLSKEKIVRRKLLPDSTTGQEIPSKRQKLSDKTSNTEIIFGQVKKKIADIKSEEENASSSNFSEISRKSVSTQTDPLWSYETAVRGKEEKFKYFTGLSPSEFDVMYNLLGGDSVCQQLKYGYDDKTPMKNSTCIKISLKSRLYLVLLRLRRGFSLDDISELMNISPTLAGAIFYTWVRLISLCLKRLSKPMLVSAHKQNENKPTCFRPFKNLKVVLDCSEFQIERSSNMQQQGNCFSQYKKYTSGKVCFAVSCYGGISHVSDVYEGRISDKELVLQMGLLDELEKGDVIMAYRGFKLEEECMERGLILVKPPDSHGDNGLTGREEVTTKSVAGVRIYVEHVIGRVKNWKLLQQRIELLLLPILPDIIFIAAYLHNFSKSYIE